ncbi:MAG: hypothetical protein M9949_07100 [Candidatus Kapabacteria bacterium]|nr:hypothetical protein [Candidatus Kapabacteria bacterium]
MTKVFKQFTLAFTMLISFLAAGQALAQNATDTIRVEYSFWNNSYYLGDTKQYKDDIRDILYRNLSTQDLMESSTSYKIWGNITLTTGLILTAYTIYDGLMMGHSSGRSPFENQSYGYDATRFNITAAIAVVLDLTGILLLLDSNSKFNRAIKAYNKNSLSSNIDYDFYIGYNRIGVVVVFN